MRERENTDIEDADVCEVAVSKVGTRTQVAVSKVRMRERECRPLSCMEELGNPFIDVPAPSTLDFF